MKSDESNKSSYSELQSRLPVRADTSAEIKILRKILQQMAENERLRIRNEFVRLIFYLSIAVLLVIFGGILLYRNVQKLPYFTQEKGSPGQEYLSTSPGYVPTQDNEAASSVTGMSLEQSKETQTSSVQSTAVGKRNVETYPKSGVESQIHDTLILQPEGDVPLRAPIPGP